MTKKDAKVWHRMLYRITGWEVMTTNTIFQKSDFDAEVTKVMAKVTVVVDVPISVEGSIMFGTWGWFTLEPVIEKDADASCHQYTHLVCMMRFKVVRVKRHNI